MTSNKCLGVLGPEGTPPGTRFSPITIVLPWYGLDTAGGAELHARQLAGALRAAGVAVEVWATTARDARDPHTPYYPHGWSMIEDIPVRRFAPTVGQLPAIARRAPARFGLQHTPPHEWQLLASLTSSDELLAALEQERRTRRWIFFLYAFPTSFFGAQIVGEQGALIPCLHDEPYAHYGTTRHLLRAVPLILANSVPEQSLIRRLNGDDDVRCVVVGEGIDLTRQGDGARLRRERGLEGPLLLFVGRRDPSKNFPQLFHYLQRYWAERGPKPQFLVAGPGPIDVPSALQPWVHDLGFVDEGTKHDAYAAADLMCMPSLLESYSLVVMEAWLQGTPALVHADCAVTVDHCRRADGGLWFRSYREFAPAIDLLLSNEVNASLGANGRAYVNQECRWEVVVARILRALEIQSSSASVDRTKTMVRST